MAINTTNDFLCAFDKVTEFPDGYSIQELRPYAECQDGFKISIQASENHYCTPRKNGLKRYDTVELGFPNREDELIINYAESDDYIDTVYGYVPVEVVDDLIQKHGGIIKVKTEGTAWRNGKENKIANSGWRKIEA